MVAGYDGHDQYTNEPYDNFLAPIANDNGLLEVEQCWEYMDFADPFGQRSIWFKLEFLRYDQGKDDEDETMLVLYEYKTAFFNPGSWGW